MKQKFILPVLAFFWIFNLTGQNPNWTLPGKYFEVDGLGILDLPSFPYDPNTGQPNLASTYSYQGTAATNVHAGYTDPWGDLMFFTVDENLYDYKGWLVGSFRKDFLN